MYNQTMPNDIETLQHILKEDPSNFQARRELSVKLANEGFNEEALANLEYLAKYFPEDADLHYNLGILYEKTKNLQKAKESYEKAISIYPQDDFYYNLGEVLVSLEDWDNAINNFEKVINNDPDDGNCYFNLGLCYFHKDEIKQATDNFQKAVEYKPDFSPYFKTPFSPNLIKWSESDIKGTSCGNGAIMRISPVGYMFNTEEEVIENAYLATIPTHNTKEAIDAATMVSLIIYERREKRRENAEAKKVEEKEDI